MKKGITEKLKETIYKTGYVQQNSIEFFQGKFYSDSRNNEHPWISYIVNITNEKKDTQLHKLERKIRDGFYSSHYPDCDIKYCIEELSEDEEKHTIHVEFNSGNRDKLEKRIGQMAIHLRKIIEEYHFRN